MVRWGRRSAGLWWLMVGFMAIWGVLGPGKAVANGLSPHDEADGQPKVRGMRGPTQVLQVTLTEGQTINVPGTGLRITAKAVKDFTSEGCLGGPVGCPDHVELSVTRTEEGQPEESQQIVLYVAHTPVQREEGIFQASVFGYHLALAALRGQQVTLTIEPGQERGRRY